MPKGIPGKPFPERPCKKCGHFYEPRSARQLYCDRDGCIPIGRVYKRMKQREYRDRPVETRAEAVTRKAEAASTAVLTYREERAAAKQRWRKRWQHVLREAKRDLRRSEEQPFRIWQMLHRGLVS